MNNSFADVKYIELVIFLTVLTSSTQTVVKLQAIIIFMEKNNNDFME